MPSDSLLLGQRKWFYWYAESTDPDLPAIEVRPKGAATWLLPAPAVDPEGRAGYRLLIAGPDADQGSASLKLLNTTMFEARMVDNPEIEYDTGRITVR